MADTLITTYLEMTNRFQFKPAYVESDPFMMIMPVSVPDVDYYLFLYRSVGEKWRWRDRLLMPRDELQAILSSEDTFWWVLYEQGAPAGYVELHQQGTSTEIAYFGLREGYMGRGLGKHLLSFGIEQAWEMDAQRVWVHTCNLDGPHALANYKARGFQVYDVTEEPMPKEYK